MLFLVIFKTPLPSFFSLHMLKIFVPILLIFVAPSAFAQHAVSDSSRTVIDSVYTLIKTRSLHRDQADWVRVDQQFHTSVDSATSFASALEAFRHVFKALDDVHSAIYYGGRGIGYFRSSSSPRDISALIDLSRKRAGKPIGQLLDGNVGYVFVPSYGTHGQESIDKAAQQLRDVVCDLAASATGGWIIDLRLNEGGNVYPMLSGLGDLLGDGLVARSVSATGVPNMSWSIQDGVLFLNEYRTTTVNRRCPEARKAERIAVLIGPATLSSGQLTAVAFSGWKRARLFGEPTADGYATSNQWYQITPTLGLNLSESYFADREGTIHKGIVLPNESISGVWEFETLEKDAFIQQALVWIQEE